MAGYPTPPAPRMALDADESFLTRVTGAGAKSDLSSGDMAVVNDESNLGYSTGVHAVIRLVWVFPELRDVAGVYLCANGTNGHLTSDRYVFAYSTDTTSGSNGTWTTFSATPEMNLGTNVPGYRSGISAVSLSAVKAVRVTLDRTGLAEDTLEFRSFHLYGSIAAGENPNRLALWNPSSDVALSAAGLDWGDVPRSSTATKTFRVKNLSAVQTAFAVTVGQEELTNASPVVVADWHKMSLDGSTWLSSVSLGNLAPGAISAVVTLRRQPPSVAQLSVWAHRLHATASTWS